MSWNVLYLRPRCEKKMGRHCEKLGLKFYLPLRQETKIYQRRKVTVGKPVFPGYFFVSYDRRGRLDLLKTNHIVKILQAPNERKLLHELAQIRKALCVDSTLKACTALKKGRRVRILTGPFMGLEGMVWSLKRNSKVRLNVEMIGQAVAVEIDREFLETVD